MTLEEEILFDGGETRRCADQYIERCRGNAINLHIYRLGDYSGCIGCEHQPKCKDSAFTAGEQAEF